MIEVEENSMSLVLGKENIKDLIYEVRGVQVMLDKDLAILYNCKNGAKTINQAVKRHINKFPERFCFQLTDEEINYLKENMQKSCDSSNSLRSQLGTLKNTDDCSSKRGQHIKYNPYAFTEQGVAMLATVLRTDVADEVSIAIMDAFVSMRRYFPDVLLNQKYITNQVLKNTEDIQKIQEYLKNFEERKFVNGIFFKGQVYDAYSKIVDLASEAKEELIIIDRFSDKNVLDIIRNLKSNVILISQKSKSLSKDILKYNFQYKNLRVVYNQSFHDRYFIIDRKKVYHLGTSINYAGCRTFSINLLEDEFVKASLIEKTVAIINTK